MPGRGPEQEKEQTFCDNTCICLQIIICYCECFGPECRIHITMTPQQNKSIAAKGQDHYKCYGTGHRKVMLIMAQLRQGFQDYQKQKG